MEKRGQRCSGDAGQPLGSVSSLPQWKGGFLREEKAGSLTFEMYFLLKGLIFSSQTFRNILWLVWTFSLRACLQSGRMEQGSC